MSTAVALSTRADAHTRQLLAGATWGAAAAFLWAGWWVASRFSITHSLDHLDLAALRFGISGLLLLPVLLRHWHRIRQVPPILLVIMVIGAGAPYSLMSGGGLRFAPAADGGALIPGVMPLFVALLSLLVLGERIDKRRRIGLGLIALGVLAIGGLGLLVDSAATPGHVMFLGGAAMWASFTIALRHSGLPVLLAAAIVCVFSLPYLPFYLMFADSGLWSAPLEETLAQALYQGVLTAFVAVYCYGRAIAALGPARGAAFAALVPVLATVMGAAFLHEVPGHAELLGVVALSLGVFLASGAGFRSQRA
jgi:drug/metabolite transporter (DMT)-like permease